MEYWVRYGLEFNPFLKNSKEILVETQEYREILFRLDYLAKTKGFGVLAGSAERAKRLCSSLDKVVYSSLTTLTINDFYRNLVTELGAQPSFRKPDNFRLIQEEITRLALEKHRTPVFIIDEAHYISNATLNDLKILFNFEMDSKDRAVILLAGLPQLNNYLRLSIHEPLRQRIVMNYHLDDLSKEEGRIYISEKLRGAGCSRPVFEDAAVGAVLNAAEGIPRVINKLCSYSLLVGGAKEADLITADIVMQAVNDCELG